MTTKITVRTLNGQEQQFDVILTEKIGSFLWRIFSEYRGVKFDGINPENASLVYNGKMLEQTSTIIEVINDISCSHIIFYLIFKSRSKPQTYGKLEKLGAFENYVVPKMLKHAIRSDEFPIGIHMDCETQKPTDHFGLKCITNYGTIYSVQYHINNEANRSHLDPNFIGDGELHLEVVNMCWCLVGHHKLSEKQIDDVKLLFLNTYEQRQKLYSVFGQFEQIVCNGNQWVYSESKDIFDEFISNCSYVQFSTRFYRDIHTHVLCELGTHPITLKPSNMQKTYVQRRNYIVREYNSPVSTCLILFPKQIELNALLSQSEYSNCFDDPIHSHEFTMKPDCYGPIWKLVTTDRRLCNLGMYLYQYYKINQL